MVPGSCSGAASRPLEPLDEFSMNSHLSDSLATETIRKADPDAAAQNVNTRGPGTSAVGERAPEREHATSTDMGVGAVDDRRGCRLSCERSGYVAGTGAGSGPASRITRGVDRTAAGRKSRVARPRRSRTRSRRTSRASPTSFSAARCTGTPSGRTRTRAAASRSAPATRSSSARTTSSTSAAASRFSGYKRLEAEFIAPGLFGRRGTLSVLGGWREATQVGFYGLGMTSTPDSEDRTTASSSRTRPQPRRPSDAQAVRSCAAALEVTQWKQGAGSGDEPSVETDVHAADAAGPRRAAGLPPHAGDRRPRLAAVARLHAARRASTA